MSRARLTLRLAGRDLRRRAAETVLLLVALVVAATTLTIGLVLHGQIATPYAETRAATAGPDVVAVLFPAPRHSVDAHLMRTLTDVVRDPRVRASSGPIPATWAAIRAHGISAVAEAQGRQARPSAVDRPRVVSGTWVRHGGVVLERSFARSLGVGVGDTVELAGRRVPVVGVAVTAALPPYPQLCTFGCILDHPSWRDSKPGLVWVTTADVRELATLREPLVWFDYLRLDDPGAAPAFAATHSATDVPPSGPSSFPWQEIARRNSELLGNERAVVVFGSSLLVVMALATVVVLVGGRMVDEVRRVGTLKAAGATPGYIAGLLLTSYLAVAMVSAAVGLVAGRLLAPALVQPSAGLLGAKGPTSITGRDVLAVLGTVLAVVVLASVVPAWRAARTSTVRALADAGRRPHRNGLVVGLSARLPAPALLGLRLASRRPRRALLTTLSIMVAVCGSVVVLYAQASLHSDAGPSGGPADPQAAQMHTVMVALTVLLAGMAAVNLLFVTRATTADARKTLALARALGASPAETAAGLGIAQLLPALMGLVLGYLAGVLVFGALAVAHPVSPPAWHLAVLALVTVIAVVLLTALPARLEARRTIGQVLRAA